MTRCLANVRTNKGNLSSDGRCSRYANDKSAPYCGRSFDKMIARKPNVINVSEGTVKSHLHAVFRKVDVVSQYELPDVFDRCRSS
jgi:hypothetical protein